MYRLLYYSKLYIILNNVGMISRVQVHDLCTLYKKYCGIEVF